MPHLDDPDFDGISGDVYNGGSDGFTSLPRPPPDGVAMRYHFRQMTVSLLLSAFVLACGITPPLVQHAHTGGDDTTHRHGDCHELAHSGRHEHDGGHHGHATATDVSLLADCVAHLHWRFFGVEFSMPTPDEPTDNDDQSTVPPAIVRATNEEGVTARSGPSFDRVPMVGVYGPSADVVRDSEPAARPPNRGTSIPLCDSARLERSGVLLA